MLTKINTRFLRKLNLCNALSFFCNIGEKQHKKIRIPKFQKFSLYRVLRHPIQTLNTILERYIILYVKRTLIKMPYTCNFDFSARYFVNFEAFFGKSFKICQLKHFFHTWLESFLRK